MERWIWVLHLMSVDKPKTWFKHYLPPFPLHSVLSQKTLGCTVWHQTQHNTLQQPNCAGYLRLCFDSFLTASYLLSPWTTGSSQRGSFTPVLVVPLVWISFSVHLSEDFPLTIKERKRMPRLYAQELLGRTSEWGAFITLPLFSKPTLSLADISEIFCVKCEGRDSPLPPPPAPTESGRLFNTLSPPFLFAFPISDVRLCTDIPTQCRLWVLDISDWTDSPWYSRILIFLLILWI